MAFTAKDVMTLREQTGAGMMDCKRALVDADGDMDKAADLLRERGIAKAAKKASRIAAEGEKFHTVVETIAKHVAAHKPASVEELLAQTMEGGKTVELYVQEQVAVIGEKISVRRFTVYESKGLIETYIHMGGTLGVMLDFDCPVNETTKELAHNIALHTAFSKPQYKTAAEVSAETLEKEKEILKKEVLNEGKPEAIAEKIVLGKIKKFYEENCLLDQKFVKDDKVTISQLIADAAKKAGAPVSLKAFCFYVMGQGLEKKNEDLSEEVAKQVESMKK